MQWEVKEERECHFHTSLVIALTQFFMTLCCDLTDFQLHYNSFAHIAASSQRIQYHSVCI